MVTTLPPVVIPECQTPQLKFSFSFAVEFLGNPRELPCVEVDISEVNSLLFRRKALVGHANCLRQQELPAILEFVKEE